MLKKLLNSFIIAFVAEAAIGLLLLINPSIFTNTISYVLGGVILAVGMLNLISYFNSDKVSSSITKAVFFCAAGIFIITKPDFIFKILALVFGIYLLADGITSIKSSLIIRKIDPGSWVPPMVVAVLTTVLGLIITLNPFVSVETALKILGAALVISGVLSIYNGAVTKRKIKQITKNNDKFVDIK